MKEEKKPQLTNGQKERLLKKYGSGQGRIWNPALVGTAYSDGGGWYINKSVKNVMKCEKS